MWLCNHRDCSMLGFPVPHHLPKIAQVHVHCICFHCIQPLIHVHYIWPSHPLLLLLLPSVFPRIRDLFSESTVCISWPKYGSFSFSISSSSEYSGLIFLRLTCFISFLCKGLPGAFSSIRVFCSGAALRIRWPKYWSFSFSISSSSEYSGLISFRIDWIDLLAVQGTLDSHITLGRESKE